MLQEFEKFNRKIIFDPVPYRTDRWELKLDSVGELGPRGFRMYAIRLNGIINVCESFESSPIDIVLEERKIIEIGRCLRWSAAGDNWDRAVGTFNYNLSTESMTDQQAVRCAQAIVLAVKRDYFSEVLSAHWPGWRHFFDCLRANVCLQGRPRRLPNRQELIKWSSEQQKRVNAVRHERQARDWRADAMTAYRVDPYEPRLIAR